MAEQNKIWITVICWNCDKKFRFAADEIVAPKPLYLDDQGAELGHFPIRPKTYIVPCPNPECRADNEVTLL
jgi:hypothetical protein